LSQLSTSDVNQSIKQNFLEWPK